MSETFCHQIFMGNLWVGVRRFNSFYGLFLFTYTAHLLIVFICLAFCKCTDIVWIGIISHECIQIGNYDWNREKGEIRLRRLLGT